MPLIVIILLFIIITFLLLSYLSKVNPEKLAAFMRRIFFVGLFLLGVFLLMTGKIFGLVAILAGLYAFFMTLKDVFRLLSSATHRSAKAKKGQKSELKTEYLHMILDHDTGEMDGEILAGKFKGQKLSSLSKVELKSLFDEYSKADPDSVRLIDSYINRAFGDRQNSDNDYRDETPFNQEMDENEARKILGVSKSASKKEIEQAYRQMMKLNHPDKGGSSFLAAKINAARNILLKKL